MKRFLAGLGSAVVIGFLGWPSAAVVTTAAVVSTTQTGCKGSCSAHDKGICQDNYNMCTTTQATLNTGGGCAQCAHVYCDCLDNCGDDCNEASYNQCQPVNGTPTPTKDGG
jgi:hypothetical protein